MSKCTLVIMAAGLGSRYGGVKQLDPVGPSGEIIMDYSVYAAKQAGFEKVVFIIRKELEKDFNEMIGNKLRKYMEVEYVFQELEDLPEGYTVPEGRVKPWGTGHAILAIKNAVKEPFLVINADDYYGEEAFVKAYNFLTTSTPVNGKSSYSMVGFQLGNTLSDHGTVTRGVCAVNDENKLVKIEETFGIRKEGNKIVADSGVLELEDATPVSMNMWGFSPDFLQELDFRFVRFLDNIKEGDLKAEFLLPTIVDELIKEEKSEVTVLSSKDKWFGVTNREDKPVVVESFKKLVEQGVYPVKLFD